LGQLYTLAVFLAIGTSGGQLVFPKLCCFVENDFSGSEKLEKRNIVLPLMKEG